MKFIITGPGAMGCLFGAYLKRAGNDVAILDYKKERADIINRYGVRVEGLGGEFRIPLHVFVEKVPFIPDVILIFVKSTRTEAAARGLNRLLQREIPVLTLQNGLGNLEILEEVFGKEYVLGGVTAEGATLLGQGQVRHAGQGDTIIGPVNRAGGVVDNIVSAFNKAGFHTYSTDNVIELIWGKLIINVGINALTAVTGLKNGRLPEMRYADEIMEEVVQEAVAVARARGVNLPYSDPIGRVREVCRATAENISSMLQDVLNRRVTEVEFINGAIVKQGDVLGVPTPANHILTCLVRVIQQTYEESISH